MSKESNLGRFKKKKKANYKRALALIILLLIAVYIYTNADTLLQLFYSD